MKIFNYFSMGLLLTGPAFVACDNDGAGNYSADQKITLKTEYSNEFIQLFSFTASTRAWQNLSLTDRFIKVEVPEITSEIINKGAVIIYLNEAQRSVSLPFTYYQVKRAISFQPSYEKGYVYINILGNYIATVNSGYTFKVLIVTQKGLLRYKGLDFDNFEELRSILEGRA